jgi:hypothetical protein
VKTLSGFPPPWALGTLSLQTGIGGELRVPVSVGQPEALHAGERMLLLLQRLPYGVINDAGQEGETEERGMGMGR